MKYYKFIKPILFKLSPEFAHDLAIYAMANNVLPKAKLLDYPSLRVNVLGLNFSNPIGLAAGFDKNARALNCLLNQGFGFVEAGTVTPLPQTGNPKPRLFRLESDQAIINRFGFNSKGSDFFLHKLQDRPKNGIIGVNIGKNKLTEDAISDYVLLLKKFYNYSDYITINISSPNTPGLRGMQSKNELDKLLAELSKTRKSLSKNNSIHVPILIKIAPDLTITEREDIASSVIEFNMDGLIISNTTINYKDKLHSIYKNEAGGLSGKPLFTASNEILRDMYKLTKGKILIVGAGGIFSAEDAYTKIKNGASLLQIYSCLIYKGFEIIEEIKFGLDQMLSKDGFTNISQAVGTETYSQ